MNTRYTILFATLLAAFFSPATVVGQQQPNATTEATPAAYDLQRETTLLGTVQAYTPAAQTAPLGAHVTLQTSSGIIDVHVGDVRLLAANHFVIQSSDTLRIIGENVAYGKGTQFVARIIQKGPQALQVRSISGIPLSYMAPRTQAPSKTQGGVL
jgi:hypothetical protein